MANLRKVKITSDEDNDGFGSLAGAKARLGTTANGKKTTFEIINIPDFVPDNHVVGLFNQTMIGSPTNFSVDYNDIGPGKKIDGKSRRKMAVQKKQKYYVLLDNEDIKLTNDARKLPKKHNYLECDKFKEAKNEAINYCRVKIKTYEKIISTLKKIKETDL